MDAEIIRKKYCLSDCWSSTGSTPHVQALQAIVVVQTRKAEGKNRYVFEACLFACINHPPEQSNSLSLSGNLWSVVFGSSLQEWLARRRPKLLSNTHRDLIHTNLLSIFSWCSDAVHSSCTICSGCGTICSIGVKVINHFCVKLICCLRLGTSSIAATTCTAPSTTSSTSSCAVGWRLRGSGLWLVLALSIL